MESWYSLITKKVLFWTFHWCEIRSLFSKKLMEKMLFTDYCKALVLNFSVVGNTSFFTIKKSMERWYWVSFFELAMIFQDLGKTVFCAVIVHQKQKSFFRIIFVKLHEIFVNRSIQHQITNSMLFIWGLYC